MPIVDTNPRQLRGPWTVGFALDRHTIGSVFLGYYPNGRPIFDTQRPPVGQLLYQLKYRNDTKAIEPLADTAEDFLRNFWRLRVDAIVPVPPSNVRSIQPVMVVADALAARLGVPVCTACLMKVKETPQLKDITDYDKRKEALVGAFAVTAELTAGKNLLLFDDVHGSGATVSHIAEILRTQGGATVYLLTLTTK